MADIVHLKAGEPLPAIADEQPWLFVEATPDGLFFGTGGAWKPTGEWVGYCSLPEDDVGLDRALVAACAWADRYAVPTIWVQATPD